MILNFTIIIFVLINLSIYFAVKSRTSIVISLLLSKLMMIFFFSQILLNHELFKEVIIALVIFTIAILMLIGSESVIEKTKAQNLDDNFKNKINKLSIFFGYGIIFLILFFLILKQDSIYQQFHSLHKSQANQEINYDSQKNLNPDNNQSIGNYQSLSLDPKMIKQAKLRDQLADNFLLKRSTHLIIAITGMLVLSLIFSNQKNQ
jgi:hypothetical protein